MFSFFRYFFSFIALIFLFPYHTPAQDFDADLKDAVCGLLALTADGDTIAAFHPDRLLVPASNMKLVTTGLALHRLGADHTFRTRLGYSGSISGGVLHGDLYIMGGGDPTLASDDSIATDLSSVFRQWAGILASAGISRIDGHIIGDDRYFDIRMPEDRTWQWDDCGTYYGAGISALTFYENIQSFTVSPGPRPGDPVTVNPGYPVCPWMSYIYDCTTGEAGTGDRLYYYTSDLAPTGEMRGTFAVDRAAKTLECSNKFPAYTCAACFAGWLEDNGTECSKGPADTGFFSPSDPLESQDNVVILGETLSPSLKRIVFETNHESNNVYAETLFHALGKNVCGSADYAASSQAARILLSDLGLDPDAVRLQDGSGLSRHNLLSPSFLCGFLRAMLSSPAAQDYISTLPSPGSNGTLHGTMPSCDPSITSRIRLKSGSMTGVKCFSGYIFPEDGGAPAVFSVMVNNSLLSQYRLQKIIDRILFRLAAQL